MVYVLLTVVIGFGIFPLVTFYTLLLLPGSCDPRIGFVIALLPLIPFLIYTRRRLEAAGLPKLNRGDIIWLSIFCFLVALLLIATRYRIFFPQRLGDGTIAPWSAIHDDRWRAAVTVAVQNYGMPLRHPFVVGDDSVPLYYYYYITAAALGSIPPLSHVKGLIILAVTVGIFHTFLLYLLGTMLLGSKGGRYAAFFGFLVGGFEILPHLVLRWQGIQPPTADGWMRHFFRMITLSGQNARPFPTSTPYLLFLWAPPHGFAVTLYLALLVILFSRLGVKYKLLLGSLLLASILGHSPYVGIGVVLSLALWGLYKFVKRREIDLSWKILLAGISLSIGQLYVMSLRSADSGGITLALYALKVLKNLPLPINLLLTYPFGYIIGFGLGLFLVFATIVRLARQNLLSEEWSLISLSFLAIAPQIGFVMSTFASRANDYALRISGIAWAMQALLASWWFTHQMPRARKVVKMLVVVGLLFGVSNIPLELYLRMPVRYRIDEAGLEMLEVIKRETERKAVVVTDPLDIASWVGFYSGRRTVANWTLEAASSRQRVTEAFAWRDALVSAWCPEQVRALSPWRGTEPLYLLLKKDREARDFEGIDMEEWAKEGQEGFELIYENRSWSLVRVNEGEDMERVEFNEEWRYYPAFAYLRGQVKEDDVVVIDAPIPCSALEKGCDFYALPEQEEEPHETGGVREGLPLLNTAEQLDEVIDEGHPVWFLVDEETLHTRYSVGFAQKVWDRMKLVNFRRDGLRRGLMVFRSLGRDVPSIRRPLRLNFGNKFALLGYDLSDDVLRPGEVLHLNLYWRGIDYAKYWGVNHEVLLDLIDKEGHPWVQSHAMPLDGIYPPTEWRWTHIMIPDRRTLSMPVHIPEGRYRLAVRMGVHPFLELLPIFDQEMHLLGDVIILDYVWIGEREPVSPQYTLEANLGNLVKLLGYDLGRGTSTIAPGDTLHLTLYWQAQREMDEDYTVFVHLIDEEGQIGGQKDNQPEGGFYPTSYWDLGEVVKDGYEVVVESDTPPGRYRLEIGMYLLATRERLPVLDEEGQPMDDRILLGEIRVR